VLLPLFTLYVGKKRIGVRTIFWIDCHKTCLHTHEHEQHINELDTNERGDNPT
jgi:hypothetical protein